MTNHPKVSKLMLLLIQIAAFSKPMNPKKSKWGMTWEKRTYIQLIKQAEKVRFLSRGVFVDLDSGNTFLNELIKLTILSFKVLFWYGTHETDDGVKRFLSVTLKDAKEFHNEKFGSMTPEQIARNFNLYSLITSRSFDGWNLIKRPDNREGYKDFYRALLNAFNPILFPEKWIQPGQLQDLFESTMWNHYFARLKSSLDPERFFQKRLPLSIVVEKLFGLSIWACRMFNESSEEIYQRFHEQYCFFAVPDPLDRTLRISRTRDLGVECPDE